MNNSNCTMMLGTKSGMCAKDIGVQYNLTINGTTKQDQDDMCVKENVPNVMYMNGGQREKTPKAGEG